MRVYGYARVSSIGQAEGTSLQDQQNVIAQYAASRGLKVTTFHIEAESAVYEKIEHREQMRLLLAAVRKGDLVLCDKLDRWSRDPEFTYRSIREILAAGANFYAVGDRCDPSTPDGDTMLGFRVLFAREEHKRIKQRLVGTRKLLRDAGYYVEGLPPVGYVRPRTSDRLAHNILAIDETYAPAVRDLFDRCIKGASVGDLVEYAAQAYPSRTWEKKATGRMLRSRVYLGEYLDTKGLWTPGKHAPIVDARTFAQAQRALDGRRTGGDRAHTDSKTRTWLLRVIGVCGACDAKISACYGANGTPDERHYYRCPRGCRPMVRVEPYDAQGAVLVVERLTGLRAELARPAQVVVTKDYTPRKLALAKKRERSLEAFTDGNMSKVELKAALEKIDRERAQIDEAEHATAPAAPADVLAHVENIAKAWRAADVAAKREIVGLLAHKVGIRPDSPPVFLWKTQGELFSA